MRTCKEFSSSFHKGTWCLHSMTSITSIIQHWQKAKKKVKRPKEAPKLHKPFQSFLIYVLRPALNEVFSPKETLKIQVRHHSLHRTSKFVKQQQEDNFWVDRHQSNFLYFQLKSWKKWNFHFDQFLVPFDWCWGGLVCTSVWNDSVRRRPAKRRERLFWGFPLRSKETNMPRPFSCKL